MLLDTHSESNRQPIRKRDVLFIAVYSQLCLKQELNLRPPAYKADALPTKLLRLRGRGCWAPPSYTYTTPSL